MIDLSHGGLPHPVHDSRFYEGVAPRRAIAFVLDSALIAALGLVAAAVFGLATFGAGFALFGPVVAATGFFYRVASIAQWSATPGMAALGIELRRRDGERFGATDAFTHTALFSLMFLFVLPQIANVAAMATLPMGRGLHDLALGSAAIHRPT